jgi:tetratricopeptide (TPR) repeat protein
MNEMLANQYFIVERFEDAYQIFEEVLKTNPSNSLVKKRLILCYIHLGNVKKAFQLFTELITTSINTMIENEINVYDQPCKKMIDKLENLPSDFNESDKLILLGILWFYCNVNNSKIYFEQLNEIIPNNKNLNTILQIINQFISQTNKEKQNGKENLFA